MEGHLKLYLQSLTVVLLFLSDVSIERKKPNNLFCCRRKGNPDEPMCIALSSDEEDNDDNSNLPGEENKEEIDVEEFGK